jgi:hypothetical protein
MLQRFFNLGAAFAEIMVSRILTFHARQPERFDWSRIERIAVFGYMGMGDALMMHHHYHIGQECGT